MSLDLMQSCKNCGYTVFETSEQGYCDNCERAYQLGKESEGRSVSNEDVIVLAEEAIDKLEDKSMPDLSVVLDNLHAIRAELVNRGE